MRSSFLLLTCLILFYCLDYFFRISTSLVFPELMSQYQANSFQISSFASAFYVGYVLMQVPAGLMLDRLNFRLIIIPAILICSLSYLLFIFSHSFWSGYLLRFIIGATSAFSFISILFVGRHHLPKRWFTLLSGLTIAMGTLAASLVEFISAVFMKDHDWHIIFSIIALLGVALGLLLLHPSFKQETPKATRDDYRLSSIKALCCNKDIILNGLMGGLFYLPTTLFASLWGIPFLVSQYRVDKAQATMGITALFAGWAIGAPLIGALVSKVRDARLLVSLSAALAALTSCALVFDMSIVWWHALVLLFLFGLFSATQVVVWHNFNALCPKNLAGLGTSYTNMLILAFGALFHLVVGFIVHHSSQSQTLNFQSGLMVLPLIFLTVILVSGLQTKSA